MQSLNGESSDCHIETMTVARAYSRRHDFALAGLTLFDVPGANGHRIEFHDETLRIDANQVQYHVNLVSSDGCIRKGILAHNETVFFSAPKFVPLTCDEWKAGPAPEKIALLRCLLTSKSLFQWTGQWVEQRVTEVERQVSNGLLEPELRSELETLASSETITLPTRTSACSSEGKRVANLAILYMVGLADQQETDDTTSWRITDKGR